MIDIVTIVGARPQFIKAASVSRAMAKRPNVREILVHTGQHFDPEMSDVFFDELGVPAADYHLGVHSSGHGVMTGLMLQALEPLLERERPAWVVVYGDTNSTVAGALAAAKMDIPVAHVEAGLRSFNRRMPEEHNRVITDHLADLLFTPTDSATDNLRREGLSEHRIRQVGDVMYDASLFYAKRAESRSEILLRHGLQKNNYALATVHRAGNTDDALRLRAIMEGLDSVAEQLPVLLPLHPRTRAAMRREGISPKRVQLIEPVGYLDMVALESNASVIATDSGGVQKEAYFHGVPCVTLRDETEWPELVELGWNHLVPASGAAISGEVLRAIGRCGVWATPYGNGKAADAIVDALGG